ncbi:MAG: Xaa-Pro peptidase family protein [Rhodospirillales bacterium]|jgi:Xaa-Pro dipeptidase|nr:Xaa-Pro peptidase family protein [Rhodospirillales bacterium]
MEPNSVGQDRIRRLQEDLTARGITAMICMKPENSFYLSGFNPIIYSHPVVAVLPAKGDPVVLVHALREDHAQESAWVRDIRLYGAWGVKKTMGPDWLKALGEIVNELGAANGPLGIEENFLPIARMRQFEGAFPNATFQDVSEAIAKSRLVKEPYEIDCMRIAAKLSDEGMDAAISAVSGGANEREVSIAAMAAMNRLWTEDYPDIEVCDFGSLEGGVHNGLWCWTMAGDRVAINADNPKCRKPQKGELVMIMIWTNANGMHAENERTVAVGLPDDEKKAAYDTVLEVRARTKSLFKPGTPVAELYDAAKQVYADLGYAKYTPGRIGHGMGLGAHEEPSLDAASKIVLAPGMVCTFEPNLRIPPWGGLQHSDTVLITDDGCEFLTTTDNGYLQV